MPSCILSIESVHPKPLSLSIAALRFDILQSLFILTKDLRKLVSTRYNLPLPLPPVSHRGSKSLTFKKYTATVQKTHRNTSLRFCQLVMQGYLKCENVC